MVDETDRKAPGAEPGGSRRQDDPDLKESATRIWLAGLGALSVAEEEGVKMFNRLVEQGKEWQASGREQAREPVERAASRVAEFVEEAEERIDRRVSAAMRRVGVPSREEIRELTRRVEELNAKIEALGGRPTPPKSG